MRKTAVGQGNTEWILQQITTEYLRKSDLHYAIAIEGEWGSGKTRFLKTRLEEELHKEGIDLKIVYVSLFGISDSNDLYRRIMAAMLPLDDPNGNKRSRAFQYILKLLSRAASEGLAFFRIFPKVNFSIDPELFTSLFLPRKHLLILDDTERRSANCDDLSLFGAVNDLVENKGVKTILVSNSFSPKCAETDGAHGPKKSPDARGFDSEVREKLVWRCLRFKPSLEDIAKSVFADPADGQDRIDIIVQAARMANCGNVRAFLKSKSFIEDLLAADKNYPGDAARKNRQSALQELISFALLICLGKKPAKPEKPDYASDDIPGIFRLQNQNERYARFSSFGCFNDYFGDSNGPSSTQLPEEYISYLERWYPQNDDTISMSELTNQLSFIESLTDSQASSMMEELCSLVAKKNFSAEYIPKALTTYFALAEIGFKGSLDDRAFVDCCSEVISKDGGSVYEDLDRALKIGQSGPCKDAMDRLREEALTARERKMADTSQISPDDPECGEKLGELIQNVAKANPARLTDIDPEFLARIFSASKPMGQSRIQESFKQCGLYLQCQDNEQIIKWLRSLVDNLESTSTDKTGTMRKRWTISTINNILGNKD